MKKTILTLLTAVGCIAGAWAERFDDGQLRYEVFTNDEGVTGVWVVEPATWFQSGMGITIPNTVSHNGVTYPVLSIHPEMVQQYCIYDEEGHEYCYQDRIELSRNAAFLHIEAQSLKRIEDYTFDGAMDGDGQGNLGELVIPAGVEYVGEYALATERPFSSVKFAAGSQVTHIYVGIHTAELHIPALVTGIDYKLYANYPIRDTYLETQQFFVPRLTGNWSSFEHYLHVPIGMGDVYRQSRWATDYRFTIVEDIEITLPVREQYVVEVYMAAQGAGEAIEAFAGDYMDQIRHADTDADALAIRNQALAEMAVLRKYKDAINAPYYTEPTEPGMRIRVRLKNNKVYEFNTRDVERVNTNDVQ